MFQQKYAYFSTETNGKIRKMGNFCEGEKGHLPPYYSSVCVALNTKSDDEKCFWIYCQNGLKYLENITYAAFHWACLGFDLCCYANK